MKCKSCDVILSDRESKRKYLELDEHIDLCDNCFSYIREDLGFGPPDYAMDDDSDLDSDDTGLVVD